MKKTFFIAATALMMACCTHTETPTETVNAKDATISTIMNRKSVRTYSGESVSDSMVNELLRAAMAAPTGMNIQPWEFIILRDTSKYEEIFGADNFNMGMYKSSSVVVVLCADTTVTRPPRENPEAPAVTRPNGTWRDDMGACTENLLLAVEANGLGACWTACYPYHDRMDPVRKALNIPANYVPYCVVPIGVPGGDEQPKDKWKPERIHTDRW